MGGRWGTKATGKGLIYITSKKSHEKRLTQTTNHRINILFKDALRGLFYKESSSGLDFHPTGALAALGASCSEGLAVEKAGEPSFREVREAKVPCKRRTQRRRVGGKNLKKIF